MGGSFDYSGDKTFFKTSYLFGPSKDLDMGLDFILDSSDQTTPVEISVIPERYNIHRIGVDFGYKWSKESETGFSVNHRERANDISEELRESFIGLSSGSVFQLYHKEALMKGRVMVTAFLNENTQIQNQTNGELGDLLQEYLSVPFRFIRGGGFKLNSALSYSIDLFAMAYYDVESDGFFGRLKLESNYFKRLNAYIGVDIVEALSEESSGFYRDFRQNDFVYAGLSYVF